MEQSIGLSFLLKFPFLAFRPPENPRLFVHAEKLEPGKGLPYDPPLLSRCQQASIRTAVPIHDSRFHRL
jgi:hypothetical protein